MKELIEDNNCIEALETDYLYVQSSQLPNAGSGLFTAIDIFKEEVISIFSGDVLTQKQALLKAEKGDDKYFINMLDGNILDCMHVNCYAKYANDATGMGDFGFKNNAKISINENDEICIIATKNIKSSQEIFCSYGKKYWKKHAPVV